MGYLLGIICLFIAGVTWKTYKNLLNPVTFFYGLWGIICIFSQMRLYGFTGANICIYLLIGLGIFCFGVGCILTLNHRRYLRKYSFGHKSIHHISRSKRPDFKLLWTLMLIVFLYTLTKLVLAIPFLLESNSIGYVRMIYLKVGAGITLNAADYYINSFIITGFRLACEVIIINELISRRKVSMKLVLLLLIIVCMNVLLSGGRMILLDLCTYFFFSIILNNFIRKVKPKFKHKCFIGILLIVVICSMIYLTLSRQSDVSFMQSIYGNFFGGVSLMNTLINDVLGNSWTFGTMFFYGILSIVFPVFNVILGIPYPSTFNTFDYLISPFYSVGKSVMNAYTTCWLYFYADFRILGIVCFSLFWGIIAANSYNKAIQKQTGANICIYMIMLNVMFYSFIRWQLCNASYLLALILIPTIYRKKYISTEYIEKTGITL